MQLLPSLAPAALAPAWPLLLLLPFPPPVAGGAPVAAASPPSYVSSTVIVSQLTAEILTPYVETQMTATYPELGVGFSVIKRVCGI